MRMILGIAASALLIAGCSSASGGRPATTISVPGPAVTAFATVTTTPVNIIATHTQTATVTYTPPPPASFGDGTYAVGTDIKAGTFHTDGGDGYCAWERLSNLDGSGADSGIIAIDNTSGGPLTVVVHTSDKGLKIQGSCTFHRV